MDIDKVKECERLCKVFMGRAKAWHEATEPREAAWSPDRKYTPAAPKESAALRRTSMELTRALADMRKPN